MNFPSQIFLVTLVLSLASMIKSNNNPKQNIDSILKSERKWKVNGREAYYLKIDEITWLETDNARYFTKRFFVSERDNTVVLYAPDIKVFISLDQQSAKYGLSENNIKPS